MSSKMKELSKRLLKSDGKANNSDLSNFFNEFLIWLNTGFNKTRPLPKSQVIKYITMSIPYLLNIEDNNLEVFVNLIPNLLKILSILVHPQTDKEIRETVWRNSISLIDSKTLFVSYNSWTPLVESAFSQKERDINFNSGTPSTYSYESNSHLLLTYLNFISNLCHNSSQDYNNIKNKVIYHWDLISELVLKYFFNTNPENRKLLNQLCCQILDCINNCQRTFKFVFFDNEVGGSQMTNFLLEALLKIDKISPGEPPDELPFHLLYDFCELTFPCQIFSTGQNSNLSECKEHQQIINRIKPIVDGNYFLLINNINNNSKNNNGLNNVSNKKFTISPLLLCYFDVIPSDEVISLLKKMSQNCKNFSAILINSIFIMINLIYPFLVKIQTNVKYINDNYLNNIINVDQSYRLFINSNVNSKTISLVAYLFAHIMRLRSLIQVVIKSSIDSRTFSAIVSLFFNIQKKEMYPFLITVFFTVLFDRRYVDMKEERDYILLLMSFKVNMNYTPNLFARIASQITVALSTFIINLPEEASREIQVGPILFDDKEISNEAIKEIGKVYTDNLFFYFPFTTNEFSNDTAKKFLTEMILTFDPLLNNSVSMAAAGAILAIIEWYQSKEILKMNDKVQSQQAQQQQILNKNLNLRKKRHRPKSHDFQSIKFSGIKFTQKNSSEYKKSNSLVLPPVITDNSPVSLDSNIDVKSDDVNGVSKLNSLLDSSSSNLVQGGDCLEESQTDLVNVDKKEEVQENVVFKCPFYIDNVLFLKELNLSFLFGYLLPYLMNTLYKTLDVNNPKSVEEVNKNLAYYASWFDKETEKTDRNENDIKVSSKKKMQLTCFNLIYKTVRIAYENNMLAGEKLAKDWCKLLISIINYSVNVANEPPINEVILAVIDCILNGYPLSFSLIPVLSQAFCKVDFGSFSDSEKVKIITYLVSVCSMIKKTIDKDKINYLMKKDNKCSFIDIRADAFVVLTHAFEPFEEVSENIDAAAFSLLIDDLYSSDENLFNLTETLVFSRLAHFEKKPTISFCQLLLYLLPTHLNLVMKKSSESLFNRLIEVPFNVLLKQEFKFGEIYDILSKCLVDISLILKNGPIFNKTLAFITIETVPDENQKILSERTKFLIANFNKPNGVINLNIDENSKEKYYYVISQNGSFYCVRNSTDNSFVIESSLPLGSSRYKISPSLFLTVPQKKKIGVQAKELPLITHSYMFSQIPSSALLFKVLSHFSQSTLKFSTTLKCSKSQNENGFVSDQIESMISTQNSFSVVPNQTKLISSDVSGANNDNYSISEFDERNFRSRSLNSLPSQKDGPSDQKLSFCLKRLYKRSQRSQHFIGVIYMEKNQVLNLNADYCLTTDFFDSNDAAYNEMDQSSSSNSSFADDVDTFIEEKISFISQTPWKSTSFAFKEFMSSLGTFQRKAKNTKCANEDKKELADDFITIHYADFHSNVIFLMTSFTAIQSGSNTSEAPKTNEALNNPSTNDFDENDSLSNPNPQDSIDNSFKMKSSFWKIIKNSHVLIVWNEDNSKFRINDFFNQSNRFRKAPYSIMRAFIVVSPLRNGLYKVSVIEHLNQPQLNFRSQQKLQNPYLSQYLNSLPPTVAQFDDLLKAPPGPLFGDSIVPKRSLGELVRAAAIYEDFKIKSLIESKEKEDLFMENATLEMERKKKNRKNVVNMSQLLDYKSQKKKKKKNLQTGEEVFSELWRDFPESFNFFY